MVFGRSGSMRELRTLADTAAMLGLAPSPASELVRSTSAVRVGEPVVRAIVARFDVRGMTEPPG